MFAHAQQVLRTINIGGAGTASSPPDLATISTAVVTTAETAEAALSENSKALENVFTALNEKGIPQQDVQTAFFNVNPQFERRAGGDTSDIIGYRMSNEVVAKVRNLDILGEVLDALVSAGSNRISGVNFGIANSEPLLNEARKRAVADAKSRAKLYSEAAGVRLGKIISISETPIREPASKSGIAAEAVGSVPIATGEVDVTATVFILFEIGDE